jgi:hypothetical protein
MRIMRFFQGWRQGEVLIVLALGLLSILLARVPGAGLLFYPFHLFGTFVHELSHGMAAILTGGDFRRFSVSPDLSGLAWSAGGIRWIITSAGYVGSAIFGGLLVVLSARGVAARSVLFFMGVILGLLCLVFVRNLFGIVSGLALSGLLILAGEKLNPPLADGLLLFLAVQMMLNALNSLTDLVWLSTYGANIMTDAQIMQQQTLIPAIFWAILWTGISVVILVAALAVAYRRTPEPLKRV